VIEAQITARRETSVGVLSAQEIVILGGATGCKKSDAWVLDVASESVTQAIEEGADRFVGIA